MYIFRIFEDNNLSPLQVSVGGRDDVLRLANLLEKKPGTRYTVSGFHGKMYPDIFGQGDFKFWMHK